MLKTLQSGIKVDSDQFYKLLEWKDQNMYKYIIWCETKGLFEGTSINSLKKEQYNELLKFAKID